MKIAACSAVCALLVSLPVGLRAQAAPPIPQLVHSGQRYQLLVDGKPFLILGGQADNATGSNAEVMKPAWESLAAMHANTVEIPIYWQMIEPEPGRYDFHIIDDILKGARSHGLRVVPLWFGSWKNGTFDYAPPWIKADPARYFLAVGARPTISPFCAAARDMDARAFAAVMKYIRTVDEERRTVIMVQVENETGLIDTDRDYSMPANQAYAAPVPAELTAYLEAHRDQLVPSLRAAWAARQFRASGTWTEVFGDLAPEVFSAWHVARYVDAVAEAGKREYPIPTYCNCALKNPGDARAGDYNSGGPTVNALDIWKAAAPHVDILSPDIYFADFLETAAAYRRPDNPLFVPETGFEPFYAAYVFATVAQFDGLGFSPYGTDNAVRDGKLSPEGAVLGDYYGMLENLMPLITRLQGSGKLHAIVQDGHPVPFGGDRWRAETIPLGSGLAAVARFNQPFRSELEAARAGGLIIEIGPDEYVVAGKGFQVDFRELSGPPRNADFFSVEEGTFQGEKWVPTRILNGGELSFFPTEKAQILRVRLLRSAAGSLP